MVIVAKTSNLTGSKWSDCDGGKDRAEINNRLPERGEVWYRWKFFPERLS